LSARPIRREALLAKLQGDDPVVLVETLGARSYEYGHLPGAVNLPPDDVRRLASTLLPDRGAEIVLYCASYTCDASTVVANELAAMGYTNLFDYHGGKADWTEAGLPIVKSGAGTSA
jgi:rhodanese-related sulfurtransferase